MTNFDKAAALERLRANDFDNIVLETSELAERIIKLSPFAVGYLGGILVESNRTKSADLMLAIDVNLREQRK